MNNTKSNIDNIRRWLSENSLDAIIIPHDDEYLSEYIPPENERLAWTTNFTGSAGIVYVSKDIAAVFVDGRYTVQVKQQVDTNLFTIVHLADTSFIEWLKKNISDQIKIAYDPRLHRVNWVKNIQKALDKKAILSSITKNPIDLFWEDRPQSAADPALLLGEAYTGRSSQKKREELGKVINKNSVGVSAVKSRASPGSRLTAV